MDLPSEEEGVHTADHVQFENGNFIASHQVEGAMGADLVVQSEALQSQDATKTDSLPSIQNYTQNINNTSNEVSDVTESYNEEIYNDSNQVINVNVTIENRPNETYNRSYGVIDVNVSATTDDNTTEIYNRSNETNNDCSIVWVRVPKTASTTIYKSFMEPLATWFQNTHIGPNTCISGPGGCSLHWNITRNETTYLHNNESNVTYETACIGAAGGECFEYDNVTRTTNFGPSSEIRHILKKQLLKKGLGKASLKSQFDNGDKYITRVYDEANGVFSPSVNAHVAFDTSLLNNFLPPKPMIFAAFREPKERLLSSFHDCIRYGAGKPGQMTSCDLRPVATGPAAWRERVATARKVAAKSNSTAMYQDLLLQYLTRCKDAVWNVYTSFLDPTTKNVSVALHNLEQYVTVGLQTNITETLQLWSKTVSTNCLHSPDYDRMPNLLSKAFNKTLPEKRERVSSTVKDSVVLVTPDIEQFDDKLKGMINSFIREDEIIYERVKALYAEQVEIMLN